MRRLMALTPVLVFTVLITGLGLSLTNDPRKMPSMLLDKTLPPFTLASLDEDGKGFSSADLKGKVSLLNIFASWHHVRYIRELHAAHSASASRPVWQLSSP